MNLRSFGVLLACVTIALAIGSAAMAQNIDAKECWLDNGMQVLMVERHHAPTIMVAILARVGSANETTGITGISHLFEHMMFKGSETIGTKDIVRDREIMARLDSLRALMRGEERVMREGVRRGTNVDMLDPAAKTPRYREMEAVFDSLILEQRSLTIKDELSEIYGKHGGSFLNAFTTEDFTAYFVRVPKNKIMISSYKAWGVNPVPMGWTETFNALQQKVVDGQDNPHIVNAASKFYEVQKYITNIHYILWTGPNIISETFYKKLPADLQKAVVKAAQESAQYEWDFVAKKEAAALKECLDKGMKMVEPADGEKEWIKRARTIWPEMYPDIGGKEFVEKAVAVIQK